MVFFTRETQTEVTMTLPTLSVDRPHTRGLTSFFQTCARRRSKMLSMRATLNQNSVASSDFVIGGKVTTPIVGQEEKLLFFVPD